MAIIFKNKQKVESKTNIDTTKQELINEIKNKINKLSFYSDNEVHTIFSEYKDGIDVINKESINRFNELMEIINKKN